MPLSKWNTDKTQHSHKPTWSLSLLSSLHNVNASDVQSSEKKPEGSHARDAQSSLRRRQRCHPQNHIFPLAWGLRMYYTKKKIFFGTLSQRSKHSYTLDGLVNISRKEKFASDLTGKLIIITNITWNNKQCKNAVKLCLKC